MTGIKPISIQSTPDYNVYLLDTKEANHKQYTHIEGLSNDELAGSLSITLKKKNSWFLHQFISLAQKISAKVNHLPPGFFNFDHFKVNRLMHGGFVTGNPGNGKIELIESLAFGVITSKQDINDKHLDGILLIVPKDKKVRDVILSQAKIEAKPGKYHAAYNYFRAFTSLFRKTKLYLNNPLSYVAYHRLAAATVDTLNHQPIKTRKGFVKSAICTAFVMRTLQAAHLVSHLTEEEKEFLKKLPDRQAQIDQLEQWLHNSKHRAGQYILKNKIFRLKDSDTLPYQIFHAIVGYENAILRAKSLYNKKVVQPAKSKANKIKQIYQKILMWQIIPASFLKRCSFFSRKKSSKTYRRIQT